MHYLQNQWRIKQESGQSTLESMRFHHSIWYVFYTHALSNSEYLCKDYIFECDASLVPKMENGWKLDTVEWTKCRWSSFLRCTLILVFSLRVSISCLRFKHSVLLLSITYFIYAFWNGFGLLAHCIVHCSLNHITSTVSNKSARDGWTIRPRWNGKILSACCCTAFAWNYICVKYLYTT